MNSNRARIPMKSLFCWTAPCLFLLLLSRESQSFTMPLRTRPLRYTCSSSLLLLSATESDDATGAPEAAESTTPAPLFSIDETDTDDDNSKHSSFIQPTTAPTTSSTTTAQFGESVSLKRPSSLESQQTTSFTDDSVTLTANINNSKSRSIVTAVSAILIAVLNYAWQYTHPITSLQLLTEMQQSSQPLSVIGTNNKPTVVDFWAPWCENCKLAAPTLYNIEQLYSDRVNFCMVNGDEASAWPYIEAFGVDAIPHLALVNSDGDVETALIGPIPKSVLEADLNVMVENANQPQQQKSLPYTMLDVFRDEPTKRRVHFDP